VGEGQVVKRVAKVCLGIGTLLVAFVAYQLWGTALYEHQAQARLRQELKADLNPDVTIPHRSSATSPINNQPANEVVSRVAPHQGDPAVGQPVGTMSIPAIGMSDVAIVEGTGEAQLEEGPGHYQGTALPGEVGNAAIAGHRTTYGAPFYNLNQLQPGNLIYIQTSQGLFEYQVSLTHAVSPSDTSVLASTPLPELTLTTCNPRYSDTQRLVVVAILENSFTSSSFVAVDPPTQPHAGKGSASVSSPEAATSTLDEVGWAVLGGALALLAAVAAVWARRRLVAAWAWVVVVVGVPVFFAGLLVTFQHVSLALPASF
jgi:sortase A